jgi:thiol-disulfide isomerase/thioredoxin
MLLRSVPALMLLGLLAGTAGVQAQPSAKDLKKFPALTLEGQKAPAFKSDFAVKGDPMGMSSLRGKVVLLDFWAVFAPPSRSAIPELIKLHEAHHEKGLEVVGLTRYYQKYDFKDGKLFNAKRPLSAEQEQAMLREFAAHRKVPYRIQTSEDAVFQYKVTSFPVAILIGRDGVVRMVKYGYSPANLKALDAKIRDLLAEPAPPQ